MASLQCADDNILCTLMLTWIYTIYACFEAPFYSTEIFVRDPHHSTWRAALGYSKIIDYDIMLLRLLVLAAATACTLLESCTLIAAPPQSPSEIQE